MNCSSVLLLMLHVIFFLKYTAAFRQNACELLNFIFVLSFNENQSQFNQHVSVVSTQFYLATR